MARKIVSKNASEKKAANSIRHLRRGSLKDFFIPHEGNGFKPKALHPKRVLFHVSMALVVKAIVFVCVLQYPLTAWMTPDVAAGEGKRIVAMTNDVRAGLSLSPLTESSKLNQAAAKKVQDMFINQYFAHRSPVGFGLEHWVAAVGYSNYAVVGENLAVGYDNAADVMAAWRKSPTHYQNLVDPNFSEIGVGLAGGQYQSQDTVFIAQYFGLPNTPAPAAPVEPTKDIQKVTKPVVAKTTTQPAAKPAPATVTISQPAGKPTEKVVKVEATLPPETVVASAQVLNTEIPLEKTTENQWQGQDVIISDTEDPSVVPPTLSITDVAGETIRTDIAAEHIVPEQASALDQYWLYRSHPNIPLGSIFNISAVYFKLILAGAIIALILHVVHRKRSEHPHLIASGLGLVACMLLLILF